MYIDIKAVLSGDEELQSFSLSLDDLEKELFLSDDVDIILPVAVQAVATNTAGLTQLLVDADVVYSTHCARCGRDIKPVLPVRFMKPVVTSLSSEDNDDILVIEGGRVDITLLMTEEISFGLPLRHLCKEDCAGLCPTCGADLNTTGCSCAKKEIDPRLADLSKFFDE